jgi:iron(III) transport system permease protein
MLPLAVPGVVLGLSYVMSFKNMPFYGTIFILVIVNIVHFFSSPYLMAYNSLSKFNPNLEDVAHTLGISRM